MQHLVCLGQEHSYSQPPYSQPPYTPSQPIKELPKREKESGNIGCKFDHLMVRKTLSCPLYWLHPRSGQLVGGIPQASPPEPREVFNLLCQKSRTPDVYILASRFNNKLPLCVARTAYPFGNGIGCANNSLDPISVHICLSSSAHSALNVVQNRARDETGELLFTKLPQKNLVFHIYSNI